MDKLTGAVTGFYYYGHWKIRIAANVKKYKCKSDDANVSKLFIQNLLNTKNTDLFKVKQNFILINVLNINRSYL